MSVAVVPKSRRSGTLLLADISGYTSFLQGVADAHRDLLVEADEPPPAFAVLSHLLDTIVETVSPAFRLAKLEGDAVFAVADDPAPSGRQVLECIRRCHRAFREQLGAASTQWACTCDGCARIAGLDLKFIVHHGSYVAQTIASREELLGSDVNVAHRLLKNHARDLLGPRPYALISEPAAAALGIATDGMVTTDETYEGGPPIRVHLLALEALPHRPEIASPS